MKSPKGILTDLADAARWHRFLFSDRERICGPNLKPGEWLERFATPEERESLKSLTSDDIKNTMIRGMM